MWACLWTFLWLLYLSCFHYLFIICHLEENRNYFIVFSLVTILWFLLVKFLSPPPHYIALCAAFWKAAPIFLLINVMLQVSQAELHRQFHALGAGVIEEVRVQRDKGFGFVRYHSHDEAARAIQMANGRIVCGKSMKVIILSFFLFILFFIFSKFIYFSIW